MEVKTFRGRPKQNPTSALEGQSPEQAFRELDGQLKAHEEFRSTPPRTDVFRMSEDHVQFMDVQYLTKTSPGMLHWISITWDSERWERAHFIVPSPGLAIKHPAMNSDILRAIGFAKAWGYGGVWVTFLHDRVARNLASGLISRTWSAEGTRAMVASAVIAKINVAAWGGPAARLNLERHDQALGILAIEGFHYFNEDDPNAPSALEADLDLEPIIGHVRDGAFLRLGRDGKTPIFRADLCAYTARPEVPIGETRRP